MIGVIQVVLKRGELVGSAHLRELASNMYAEELAEIHRRNAPGLMRYLDNLESTYTCAPRNAAKAMFIWNDTREFEIVVETSVQGNLLRCIEGITRTLKRDLERVDMQAKMKIDLRGIGDAQTYIIGERKSPREYIWNKLSDNIVALLLSVIAIIIARIWFPDYLGEAIISMITLILFTAWQAYKAKQVTADKEIYWRLHD